MLEAAPLSPRPLLYCGQPVNLPGDERLRRLEARRRDRLERNILRLGNRLEQLDDVRIARIVGDNGIGDVVNALLGEEIDKKGDMLTRQRDFPAFSIVEDGEIAVGTCQFESRRIDRRTFLDGQYS